VRERATVTGLAAVAGLAVLSVAIVAAQVTWHALGYFSRSETSIAIAAPPAPPPDIAPILALAPFGNPVGVERGPIEATTSNLTLRGVVLAVPASRSSALISQAGGEIQAFSIGETISGGAILESVAPDHAILLVAGRQEKLAFPETSTSSGVAAIRATLGADALAPGSPAAQTPQDVVDAYRQRIADNPKTVIDEFGVSATPEGYRVGANLASSVKRAGLQPGDLVIRVNGVAVGDVEKDRLLFEDVAASGRARVEVMRDDRLLILSFPLR